MLLAGGLTLAGPGFVHAMPAPPLALQGQASAPGFIAGTIADEFNGMTLPTANVRVLGLELRVITDLDGKYRIQVPAGTWDVEISFPSFQTKTVSGVVVEAGETTVLDVALRLAALSLTEEVVVTATLEPELATAEAQLLERKRAGMITDNLAREEMRATASSDAASAMKRVTGLSVVDNQYVYVRGLGERYSNTTLNGGILPTTEPDKRVVPLDLIPTGLIESIQVVKSYLPDRPAEFSGGLIQIESIKSPRRQALAVSSKQTFNSRSTFKNGLAYPGSGSDWLGFDNGRRALPGALPDEKVVRGSIFTDRGFTPAELEGFGESFENVWEARPERQSQDPDFSSSYGNSFGGLGVALSMGYRSRTRTRTEDQTFYFVGEDDAGQPFLGVQNDYDFDTTETATRLGGVGNLSFEVGARNRFSWANFWTHNSRNEARFFEGFNSDARNDIRDTRLYWIEEDILSSTLRGEHLFPALANSRLDWRVNYSRATRDEPDLREVLYEFNPAVNAFVLADESQSGFRMFNDLDDQVYEGGLDWSLLFTQWQGLPAQLKVGGGYSKRDRDFSSRRFRLTPRSTRGLDLTLPPEQLFTAENIGTAFELREETRNTDTYAATHDIASVYGMLDLPLTRSLRLVGGVRVEDSRQEVQTLDPFAVIAQPIVATLDDVDVLPGINLVYQVSRDMNARAAYSRTVNRPEFRELSPFEFTDVVGGRAVVGNSELTRALIDNLDLRWEWFVSSDEVLAVSLFYKKFTDPIERVVQPTAQLRTSYTNAAGATNKGIELEVRKRLSSAFAVNVNYTYVDSEIELDAAALQVQTSLRRPLVGQSPHVVNAQLAFRHPASGLDARLLFNYFGERVTDVGALGLPDIFESDRGQLDLVLEKSFGGLGVQLLAANLNDAPYRFTQGGLDQRVYRVGRDLAFRLSYNIF